MKRMMGVAALVGLLVAPATAQGGRVGGRADALRSQIEQAFGRRIREALALTDEQAVRMQKVVSSYAERRRSLEAEETALRQALAGQLRPGVAANGDSVAKVVTALGGNQVAYGETFRDEIRDLTPILTPVQLGQFYLERDRLLQRIRDIQAQSRLGVRRGAEPLGGGGRPGTGG